jgi:phosphate:Na+ symporter
MSQATDPLRSFEPFLESMRSLDNVLLGVLVGAAATAIMQSSSATTGIVILFAAEGLLTLEAGIALVLGANIGTCATVMLAAIGKPLEARRAAFVHVIVNVLGVLLWIGFVPQFAEFVQSVTVLAEPARQIANAHTLFNMVNLFVFIWFVGPLAYLVVFLTPLRSESTADAPAATFLDELYLDQPALALDRVGMELVRLAERVVEIVRDALPVACYGTSSEVASLRARDDTVDGLYDRIVTYLGQLSQKDLVDPQPARLARYIAAANILENVGDVIETGYAHDALQRLDKGLRVSDATFAYLQKLHDLVLAAGALALRALLQADIETAGSLEESKRTFNALAEAARSHLARRLIAEEPARLDTYRFETDMVENLKRMHTLFRRLTKTIAHSKPSV